LDESHVPDVLRIRAQAFNVPSARPELDGVSQYRGLCAGDRVLAILRLRPDVQCVGGAPVPVTKVGSVAVDVAERGRGLGGQLLRAALVEMAESGSALSVLHPTVVGVYQAVGYELAGTRTRYRVPVTDLPRSSVAGVDVCSTPPDAAERAACHARLSRSTTGLLSGRIGRAPEADGWPHQWLVAREAGEVTGYLRYRQTPDGAGTAGEEAGYRFSIDADELHWTDARAARALLAAVAGHSALGTTFSWLGPSADPLLSLVPSGRPVVEVEQRWMSRVVDLAAALTARGWPVTAELSIRLRIDDPVLARNDRVVRLSIRDGAAAVDAVPDSDGRAVVDAGIDVGALAALYTGWAAAPDLVRLGRLTGADRRTVDALAASFAGPRPHLLDWF
jgi:predicted acetyltransferase